MLTTIRELGFELCGSAFVELAALTEELEQQLEILLAVAAVGVLWAFEAGRSAATQRTDWNLIATRAGFLVALLLVSAWLATRSFRAYQRSI